MNLKNYFAGEHIRLRSSQSARTSAERINQAAGSAFSPFTTGVVGRVRSGHIRLQYRSSPFEYNAKPVLSGRIQEDCSGSIFDLRYGAPDWVYVFYLFWYLFLGVVALIVLVNGWAPDLGSDDKVMTGAVFALLVVFPLALHAVGTRRSDEELLDLLDFLAQHAEAKL